MLKPGIEKLFREYAEAHQHPTNQLTHKIAIPLIVFHILVMLDWVKLFTVPGTGFQLSLAYFAYAAAGLWYLSRDLKLGLILVAAFAPAIPLGWMLPKLAVVGLAVVGWTIQFAGHAVWEKKRPSFFSNLVHALIGPMFFVAIVTGDWAYKPAPVSSPAV